MPIVQHSSPALRISDFVGGCVLDCGGTPAYESWMYCSAAEPIEIRVDFLAYAIESCLGRMVSTLS